MMGLNFTFNEVEADLTTIHPYRNTTNYSVQVSGHHYIYVKKGHTLREYILVSQPKPIIDTFIPMAPGKSTPYPVCLRFYGYNPWDVK